MICTLQKLFCNFKERRKKGEKEEGRSNGGREEKKGGRMMEGEGGGGKEEKKGIKQFII